MRKKAVIELHEFTPILGITDEALLYALRKAETRFFRKQSGFIRCEILHDKEIWVALSYWNCREEACRALKDFLESSCCFPLIQMISPVERRLYMKRELITSCPCQSQILSKNSS